MKTLISLFILYLAISMFCCPFIFAQEYISGYLPEGAKVRIGKGSVNDIAFSPDNTQLAVGSSIGIWIYDRQSGKELALLTEHTSRVSSVCFSADGTQLASGSYDHTIMLWDLQSSEIIATLSGHTGSVYSVAFSPDGKTLASGSSDSTIRLWDIHTGKIKTTLTGHKRSVYSVAFSPDGNTLVSGSRDEFIRCWDVKTGEPIRTIAGHVDRVSGVIISPDGEKLASYGYDEKIHVWNAKTGEFLTSLVPNYEGVNTDRERIYSIAFFSDSHTLISGSNDGTIRVWDINKKQIKFTHNGNGRRTYTVKFNPKGNTFASYGSDNTIGIWDIATGKLVQTFNGHTVGSVGFAMYASHGRTLACLLSTGDFQLWDTNTHTLIKTVNTELNRITCTAYSPDNVTYACGNSEGALAILDADSGEQYHIIMEAHTARITSVAFNADGSILASCGYDKVVRLWSAHTGNLINSFIGHEQNIYDLAFSPSGNMLISAGSGTIRMWDVSTGKTVKTIENFADRINKVAYSPSGNMIVSSSSDDIIRFWDAKTGEHIKSITPKKPTISVAFSPDGRTLASSHHGETNLWDQGEINLWDIDTGELKKTLIGHTEYISTIVFSPDGKTLMSSGSDCTMIFWEINPW
ncbi:MAG: WD40 repeat domain-containing protein [Candidatus Poribacteria bacterium]|nr:WD40 repeat domain-containing protein [Candidatus Poribacteria bacterium]